MLREVEERTCYCEHCGRPFEPTPGPGRPRKYCRRSCRQRAHELRRHDEAARWPIERYQDVAARLAEREDVLDRLDGVVDELRRDVEDGVVIDGSKLLRRLEAALRA